MSIPSGVLSMGVSAQAAADSCPRPDRQGCSLVPPPMDDLSGCCWEPRQLGVS
jgi:hypothetical protein